MDNYNENITPEVTIKLYSKKIESKVIHTKWTIINTPYMIFYDGEKTRRMYIKNKKKIILYYLYRLTGIKWFIKKYNEK